MNIACVGPFCDSNFGDYAMLVNDIYSFGDHSYTIFTFNGELMQEVITSYLSDYQIKICVVKSKYHYQAPISEKYVVEYDTNAYVPIELTNELEDVEQIRTSLKPIDMVLVIGGGYFNHVWNAKHRRAKLLSILGPILLADEMKKRIIFLGNTYGPFDGSQELYANFFNSLEQASFASRDDLYSMANLKKLGITAPIALLPDDLYFLAPQFSLGSCSYSQTLPENYLILELYASIGELQTKMERIRNFVLEIKKRYGLSVVLFPLDRKFGGEYQSDLLASEIRQLIYLDFQGQGFRRVEDVAAVLQGAKIVLCQRYHLFLFAIANNIPAVQILKDVCGDKRYYYSKTKGLLRQVFKSQPIKEEFFMALGMDEGIQLLLKNLEGVIKEQCAYFNQTKILDEEVMQQRRKDYFEQAVRAASTGNPLG